MTIGAPVLLSGKEVSRVGIGHDSTEKYQESLLQELIHRQPSILPVSDFLPRVTGLFSLGREIPVNTGGSEGYIDNLLVTDDGRLVIVETKLWRNPESTREVIAQTLQYGMAVTRLPLLELENSLRRGSPGGRLGPDETLAEYVQNLAASSPEIDLADDFEDAFDRMRRSEEILLLIVADCIRPSAERIVHWMNSKVGSAPYTLGLVELCLYDLPDAERIVIPRTLLRIKEASRHVVSINLQAIPKEQVTVSVTGAYVPPGKQKRTISPPPVPLTEERLTDLIRAKNPPEILELTERLRAALRETGLQARYHPVEISYGVQVDEDIISLVHLTAKNVYFLIPKRAAVVLGDDRLVECRRKMNEIAAFYPDADDPRSWLTPRYAVLLDKVDAFVSAVAEIAELIRSATEEAS